MQYLSAVTQQTHTHKETVSLSSKFTYMHVTFKLKSIKSYTVKNTILFLKQTFVILFPFSVAHYTKLGDLAKGLFESKK